MSKSTKIPVPENREISKETLADHNFHRVSGSIPKGTMRPFEFAAMFEGTISEIEDFSMGLNKATSDKADEVRAFLSYSEHSEKFWNEVVKKPVGYTFFDRGVAYIKTGDKKLEPIKDYIVRLEKAAIESFRQTKAVKQELNEINELVSEHLVLAYPSTKHKAKVIAEMLQYYIDLGPWDTFKWACEKLILKLKYSKKHK